MKECGFCSAGIYPNGTIDGKTGIAYHHKCVIKHLKTEKK